MLGRGVAQLALQRILPPSSFYIHALCIATILRRTCLSWVKRGASSDVRFGPLSLEERHSPIRASQVVIFPPAEVSQTLPIIHMLLP